MAMQAFILAGVIGLSVLIALASVCGILAVVIRLMRKAPARSMHPASANASRGATVALADIGAGAGGRADGARHAA